MKNVLIEYSKEDIVKMFSKYYTSDFIFDVGSDATAGVRLPNEFSKDDIEQCKERFINLGFEVVADKYLIDVQRKKYHFMVFYTDLRKLSDDKQAEIKNIMLQRFDDVTVKKSGEIMVTKTTENRVLSYIEEQMLIDFLKKYCSTVKLTKRVPGTAKFLCKWQIK